MYVDLPLMSRDLCKKLLENVTDFPPGMICAGYMEGQKDACQVTFFFLKKRKEKNLTEITSKFTLLE